MPAIDQRAPLQYSSLPSRRLINGMSPLQMIPLQGAGSGHVRIMTDFSGEEIRLMGEAMQHPIERTFRWSVEKHGFHTGHPEVVELPERPKTLTRYEREDIV